MKSEDVKIYIVEVCQKVIATLSSENKIEQLNLNIRIDMQDKISKPVFGLFDKSTFLARSSLKEIIHAGGGIGMSMLIGMYIRNIIKDIFLASLKRFEITDTKDIFVLLYLKENDDQKTTTPMMAVFVKGKLMDTIDVGEIVAA